jgi:hypothetical protein
MAPGYGKAKVGSTVPGGFLKRKIHLRNREKIAAVNCENFLFSLIAAV